MRASRVELVDVRAWPKLGLDLAGSTALIGGNATGKTAVIEALFYAATLRSHRTSSDQALIRTGAERAVIRVSVQRTRTETIDIEIAARGRSRAQLGGASVASRREVLGVLRVSLFAPERVEIVRGDPSERRTFANELLTMLHPRFAGTLKEYDRVLRQRNRLLRAFADGEGSLEGIDAWDETLLDLGAEICHGRAETLSALAPLAAQAFDAVGGGGFSLHYSPRCEDPGSEQGRDTWRRALADKLAHRRDLERIRGTTLVGPHRDEVDMAIGALPARTHASHGEGWLAGLALSIAAHRLIMDSIGEPPVLLLDDPFTLLDPDRRERLVAALPEGQVIVTAADPAEIPAPLDAERVDVGSLREAR